MVNMRITGLDKLQRELQDAQQAFRSLNGTIATLKWDPSDPASVQDAMRVMDTVVDSKTAPYRRNNLVVKVADALKESYRNRVLDQRVSAGK